MVGATVEVGIATTVVDVTLGATTVEVVAPPAIVVVVSPGRVLDGITSIFEVVFDCSCGNLALCWCCARISVLCIEEQVESEHAF